MSGVVTSYTYDDAGHRVSETTGGVKKIYLNDDINPTGYSQPIEEKIVVGNTSTLSMTYLLGDHVYGQITGGGSPVLSYLQTDGHGSTRQLTDTSGHVTEAYNYKAWGEAVGFDPKMAGTVFLFAGDSIYDNSTGISLHGNGVRGRAGFSFLQRDEYHGDNQDPLSLHKYLYGWADAPNMTDPSGYSVLTDIAVPILIDVGAGIVGAQFLAPVLGGIAVYQGIVGGITNSYMAPADVDPLGSFGVGFAGSFTTSILGFLGMPCFISMGIGSFITSVGNDYLEHGSEAFSLEHLGNSALNGTLTSLLGGLLGLGCFTAETPVLLGDGRTKMPIEQVRVGQRVATDGGMANSADGKTADPNPRATAVDPATWRLVTILAGDLFAQTLVPMSWIQEFGVALGNAIRLIDVIDLKEMGVSEELVGTVVGIAACPDIEADSGRVVLTTINHLSENLYLVTFGANGRNAETISVTGHHRFYTLDHHWTMAQQLMIHQQLCGIEQSVSIKNRTRDAGTRRVYNISVEGDHVYYVGSTSVLVHNACKWGNSKELKENLLDAGEIFHRGADAAHVVPADIWGGRSGTIQKMIAKMHDILEEVGIDINDAENGFFTTSASHNGTHSDFYIKSIYESLNGARGSRSRVLNAIEEIKEDIFNGRW